MRREKAFNPFSYHCAVGIRCIWLELAQHDRKFACFFLGRCFERRLSARFLPHDKDFTRLSKGGIFKFDSPTFISKLSPIPLSVGFAMAARAIMVLVMVCVVAGIAGGILVSNKIMPTLG
jgi:hypothetical protein